MNVLYYHIHKYRKHIKDIETNKTYQSKYIIESTSFNIKDIKIKITKAYLTNGYYIIVYVNNVKYIEFSETILDDSSNFKYTEKIYKLLDNILNIQKSNWIKKLFFKLFK